MYKDFDIAIKKRLFEFLLILVTLLSMDIILNIILFKSFISYFLLELLFILIILMPMFMFKHNFVANIYTSLIFAATGALFIVNLELYSTSADIFSFSYLALAGEATAVMSIDFINFSYIFLLVGIVLVYFGLLFVINFFLKGGTYNLRKGLLYSTITLAICLLSRILVFASIEAKYSNTDFYYKETGQEIVIKQASAIKRYCLKNYGLFTYTYSDLSAQIVDVETFGESTLDSDKPSQANSITGTCKGYNVIEIMIETGTSSTVNETLTPNLYKLMTEGITFTNNYSKNKTNISEFIGITGSATKNVKDLDTKVPMSLPSVLRTNFEYETRYFHANYATFYNRGILMPNLGFDESYFINSDKDRTKSFDDSVIYLDSAKKLEWFNNYNGKYPYDYKFETAVEEYLVPETDNPFYSFYTTLSMHGPYNYNGALETYYLSQYKKLQEAEEAGLYINPIVVDESNSYSQIAKTHFDELQCKTMVFDQALGNILTRLDTLGIMDNTLLVLYGDHDPYYKVGLDTDLKYYIYNVSNSNIPSVDDQHKEYYAKEYETFLTFYNPNLSASIKENVNSLYGFNVSDNRIYYNAFSSPYVIAPTILDLLGIQYNESNYMSDSIFDKTETTSLVDDLFYSTELNLLFTDKLMSDGGEVMWTEDDISIEYKSDFDLVTNTVLAKISKFDSYYQNGKYNDQELIERINASYSYF